MIEIICQGEATLVPDHRQEVHGGASGDENSDDGCTVATDKRKTVLQQQTQMTPKKQEDRSSPKQKQQHSSKTV